MSAVNVQPEGKTPVPIREDGRFCTEGYRDGKPAAPCSETDPSKGTGPRHKEVDDRRACVEEIFREHAEPLYRYLQTFRLPDADTYDLVQDAYEKLLQEDALSIRQPRAWLFKVGRNLAINKINRRKRRPSDSDVDNLADSSPGTLSGLIEDENRARLWQAFQDLPASYKEMFELHLEHELSYRQIAGVLGRSEVSVRVAMHRGRKLLRKTCDRQKTEGGRT